MAALAPKVLSGARTFWLLVLNWSIDCSCQRILFQEARLALSIPATRNEGFRVVVKFVFKLEKYQIWDS